MSSEDHSQDASFATRCCPRLLGARIAGGPRWGYVLGPVVLFLFLLQVVTGVLLMTVYSPSATTAWSSVWYIQTLVPAGWFIRGLHHFGSDAMIIVLALHVLHIVVTRAFLRPRAPVWWLTLCLLALTLMLSVNGHLLPWDQEGYWGTKVRLNILARTPLVGDVLRRLLVGGSELGHLTLTRFYTLHVIVLSGLAAVLLWRRATVNRRIVAGVLGDKDSAPGEPYFPGQFVRDCVACSVILVALLGVVWYGHGMLGGALLDAPADPTASDFPARPEWHTLFLYQWLKYFPGPAMELLGANVVPIAIAAVLFAFPMLPKIMPPRASHAVAMAVTVLLVIGIGWLTYLAVRADRQPSDERVQTAQGKRARGEPLDETDEAVLRAHQFNRQRAHAQRSALRAMTLAAEHGIPPTGPRSLLENDPVTRGPGLFAAHCASCHRYDGHNGLGNIPAEQATSSDLAGYASQEWVRGLLANPMHERYFGRMTKPDGEPAHTRMSRWIGEQLEEHESEKGRRALFEEFNAVAAYLEDESLRPGRLAHVPADQPDAQAPTETPSSRERTILRGRRFFMTVCNECHTYNGERSGTLRAPEMAGYGSVPWLELMIAEPSHDTRYRSRGREPAQMPSFRDRLGERDRSLIARWLHDRRVTGSTIGSPER